VAELLSPLYEAMAERVRRSRVIHTDDTPVKVLDPVLPHCRTGRFWVYCGDWNNPYSVYEYTASRKRDGPAEFLADYRGYLQADAFAGYDGIYAAGAVKQVLCWAHARRKFFDAQTSQPGEAGVALAYIGRLYKVERAAKQLAEQLQRETEPCDEASGHATKPFAEESARSAPAVRECATELPGKELARSDPAARERWHDQRAAMRRERSVPILAEFRSWLEEAQRRVLPKSPVGRAIAYALPRWDGLTRYCDHGALSIDNNLAERTLRPCAIGRKNWTFLGSDHGGRTAAILYSFTASCKANQVEPFAYLRDVIQQMAKSHRAESLTSAHLANLLPNVWLKSHPTAHRPWSR